MDRVFILNNVSNLPVEQLGDSIIQGIVTMMDLQQTGDLPHTKRIAIDSYINGVRQNEAENDKAAWNQATTINTLEAYRQYLDDFPNGQFLDDANKRIKDITDFIAEKEKILGRLKDNPSSVPSDDIRKYLQENPTFRKDLEGVGIPDGVIRKLIDNPSSPSYNVGKTPDSIPDGYTEVYFWGVKGSGKTTALASVLKTADDFGYLELAPSPGYNYMKDLKNMFDNDIPILPEGNAVDDTQYLPFTLKKGKEKYYRSVSLVELSGEVFECFLFKNSDMEMPSPQHKKTFETLLKFLDSDNPKMHFFFVDYGRENRKDKKGNTQSDYLNAAATFFNKSGSGIFRKSDAIYIVVTKSDLIPGNTKDKGKLIKKYLEKKFPSLVSSLRSKCNSIPKINNGKLLGIPFSLGKVYFDNICDFDNSSASNLIDILYRRIQPSANSLLTVFNN